MHPSERNSSTRSPVPEVAALVLAFAVVVAGTTGVLLGQLADRPMPPAAADASLPTVDHLQSTPAPTAPAMPEGPPQPEGPVQDWPHDALARVEDPNILQPGFVPLPADDAATGITGPRLAFEDVPRHGTLDLGTTAITMTPSAEVRITNVGDEPLRIARIYPSVRAMSVRIGARTPAAAGWLRPPFEIAPGAESRMALTVDAARLPYTGTQPIHVQIFSNDPRHEAFDPSDPDSHETRLRVVVERRPADALRRPISPEEIPVSGGAPRVWIPELARDGRGGDVLELRGLPVDHATEVALTIQNLGDGPLRIDPDPPPRSVDRLPRSVERDSIAAGDETRMSITLEPPEDDGVVRGPVYLRRSVRLLTNDPLAPELVIAVVASFGEPDGDALPTPDGLQDARRRP